jgi:hypothetical protein
MKRQPLKLYSGQQDHVTHNNLGNDLLHMRSPIQAIAHPYHRCASLF